MFNRVAIIGGGVAGLAAAKALSMEPVDMTIDLYERRNGIGGLWNYNKNSNESFISGMYKYLETNLQPNLMEYKGVEFVNPNHRSYPTRHDVYDYLVKYYNTIDSTKVNFLFNHNVINIDKDNLWNLRAEFNQTIISKQYDAIIIANGHFSKPYIPHVPGLSIWPKQDIIHSRDFIDCSQYHDLNVLIVGNSHSGIDIATQVYTTANKVYISGNNHKINQPFITIPIIKKYDFNNNKSIILENNQIVSQIDKIIFCTGYEYDYPFLKIYQDIITPFQIFNLYKQVFYINDVSLCFICLGKGIIPMPLSEIQSAIVARVFSGRIKLPNRDIMEQDYQQELHEKGDKIHDFGYPLDIEYYQQLLNILDANPHLKTLGLVPRYWTENLIKDRSQTSIIKQKRLEQVIQHAIKLKLQGKEFSLLDQNVTL